MWRGGGDKNNFKVTEHDSTHTLCAVCRHWETQSWEREPRYDSKWNMNSVYLNTTQVGQSGGVFSCLNYANRAGVKRSDVSLSAQLKSVNQCTPTHRTPTPPRTHPSRIQTNFVFGRRVMTAHNPEIETETVNCCIHHLAQRLQSCSPSGRLPAVLKTHCPACLQIKKRKKKSSWWLAMLYLQSSRLLRYSHWLLSPAGSQQREVNRPQWWRQDFTWLQAALQRLSISGWGMQPWVSFVA